LQKGDAKLGRTITGNDEDITKFIENIDKLLIGDLIDDLKVLAEHYINFMTAREKIQRPPELSFFYGVTSSITEAASISLAKHLKNLNGYGSIRPVNFERAAKMFYGVLEQYVLSVIFMPGSYQGNLTRKELINNCVSVFTNGLLLESD
jgi:hypothetical protein